jgi:peptidoglycan/LPS O-acetylase OafA/YrhL
MKLHIRPLFPILLLVLLLIAAAPPGQLPDPDQFAVYGVPWALVGLVIGALLVRYAGIGEEVRTLVAAGWAVVGYLVIQNLPDIETGVPWLPKYLPQVLWAVLIFGSQLGLVPGALARKTIRILRR